MVILNEWTELTEERLDKEWQRMSNNNIELDRIFWPYWENRLREKIDQARSYLDEDRVEGHPMEFAAQNFNVPESVLTPTQPEGDEKKYAIKGKVGLKIKRKNKQ